MKGTEILQKRYRDAVEEVQRYFEKGIEALRKMYGDILEKVQRYFGRGLEVLQERFRDTSEKVLRQLIQVQGHVGRGDFRKKGTGTLENTLEKVQR